MKTSPGAALSSRTVLVLATTALVVLTSSATAMVVLSGTAAVVSRPSALGPLPATDQSLAPGPSVVFLPLLPAVATVLAQVPGTALLALDAFGPSIAVPRPLVSLLSSSLGQAAEQPLLPASDTAASVQPAPKAERSAARPGKAVKGKAVKGTAGKGTAGDRKAGKK